MPRRSTGISSSRLNKHSPRFLVASAVFCSTFGGVEIGWGIQELITTRVKYDWIGSILFGVAFVCYGIFWAVMLVRRVNSATVQTPEPQE
ncbi:MAG: hypothetical protein WB680_15450 [Candidatus Acidiferrales bacterium]